MKAATTVNKKRSWWRVIFLSLLIPFLLLVEERIRGHLNLKSVQADMVRRGQITEYAQLQPDVGADLYVFTNRMAEIVKALGYSRLSGGGSTIFVEPGKAARGSQAVQPIMDWSQPPPTFSLTNHAARLISGGGTNTWEDLEKYYADKQSLLAELRQMLSHPPHAGSSNYLQNFRASKFPNFVSVRIAAQCLNDAAILHLHQNDLNAVGADLVAMSDLARMNDRDPHLVPQMLRVAISGIGSATMWDALQTDDWTEVQLEHLQRCIEIEPILPSVVKSLHSRRLESLESYRILASETYRTGENRRTLLPAFIEWQREYLFHPLWKFSWAEQEMALYLQRTDFLTTRYEDALRRHSFENFEAETGMEPNSHLLFRGRFYLEPPSDRMTRVTATSSTSRMDLLDYFKEAWHRTDFSLPSFPKATITAVKNENLRQMALIAIALKRYQLRHGRLPDTLAALTPDLLSEVPLDWFDGQTLRYRRETNDSYILYSVGSDGKDDGGDASLSPSAPVNSYQFYYGRDLVWPAYVPWEK